MSNPQSSISPSGALAPLSLFVALSLGAGCASSQQALEKQIEDLELDLTRAKADKANLVAEKSALDDRILLLEKRLERCSGERDQRKLKVVRLKPGEEASALPAAADEKGWGEERADEGGRPVLKLVGVGRPAARHATGPAPAPLPAGVSGDDLGVVSLDGAPDPSEPAAGDPMNVFQAAYRAFSNGNHDEALSGFSEFIRDYPEHGYADNAMFWRGEVYLARGELLKAVGELERLVRRYPRSEKAPSALYRIGFAYDKLHDRAKATEYYFKVVERYPGTESARKASQRVAVVTGKRSGSGRLLKTATER